MCSMSENFYVLHKNQLDEHECAHREIYVSLSIKVVNVNILQMGHWRPTWLCMRRKNLFAIHEARSSTWNQTLNNTFKENILMVGGLPVAKISMAKANAQAWGKMQNLFENRRKKKAKQKLAEIRTKITLQKKGQMK